MLKIYILKIEMYIGLHGSCGTDLRRLIAEIQTASTQLVWFNRLTSAQPSD